MEATLAESPITFIIVKIAVEGIMVEIPVEVIVKNHAESPIEVIIVESSVGASGDYYSLDFYGDSSRRYYRGEIPVEVIAQIFVEIPVEVSIDEIPVEVIAQIFVESPVEVIRDEIPVEVIAQIFVESSRGY